MAAPKAITQAPVPVRISDAEYYIDSFTQTLGGYFMRLREHGWECECWHYRRNFHCKHLDTLAKHLPDSGVLTIKPGDLALWTPARPVKGVYGKTVRVLVKRINRAQVQGNPDTALVEFKRGRDTYQYLANLSALQPVA
jgi:hypothetical protein